MPVLIMIPRSSLPRFLREAVRSGEYLVGRRYLATEGYSSGRSVEFARR